MDKLAGQNLHIVKRADNGDLGASQFCAKSGLEGVHGSDGTNERSIVTIGTGTSECHENGKV